MPKLIQAFGHALRGLSYMLKNQRGPRIELAASVLVVGAGLWRGQGRPQWTLLAVAIGLVWMAEAFNIALEVLADKLHPKRHPAIGEAKDLAAGAVLITVLISPVIAWVVFWPEAPIL
jgi:diacylglycerol kinase